MASIVPLAVLLWKGGFFILAVFGVPWLWFRRW